jgi:ubiquinone/menaquinone biosynthesis C-methylase UbiE/GNAT superfamily N-acetyltransferase
MKTSQDATQNKYESQTTIDNYSIIAYGFQQGLGLAEGFYAVIMTQFINAFRDWNQSLAVLDVGCGVGRFMFELATLYPRAKFVGVDYSQLMIERATQMLLNGATINIARKARNFSFQGRELPNVALQQADAQCLPFADQSFDCVNATNLLDRVPDAAVVIQELLRVLKPGGTLLLSSPLNFDGFEPAKLYSIPELLRLLESRGLHISCCLDDVPYQEYRDARNTGYWRSLLIRGVKRAPTLDFRAPAAVSVRAQAEAYKAVFESPPWQESWPIQQAEASIQQLQCFASGTGEVLFNQDNEEVVGFWYGYLLGEQARFNPIAHLVAQREPLFYLAEFGIHPLWQGRGLGQRMMQRIGDKYSMLVTRTINPAMVRLLKTCFRSVKILTHDFIDPEQPSRHWYLCQNT